MPQSLNVTHPLAALVAGPVVQLLLRNVGARKPAVQLAAVFAVQQFFAEAGCRKGYAPHTPVIQNSLKLIPLDGACKSGRYSFECLAGASLAGTSVKVRCLCAQARRKLATLKCCRPVSVPVYKQCSAFQQFQGLHQAVYEEGRDNGSGTFTWEEPVHRRGGIGGGTTVLAELVRAANQLHLICHCVVLNISPPPSEKLFKIERRKEGVNGFICLLDLIDFQRFRFPVSRGR